MPTLLDSSNPQNIKQEPLGFKVSRGPLLQPIQPQVIPNYDANKASEYITNPVFNTLDQTGRGYLEMENDLAHGQSSLEQWGRGLAKGVANIPLKFMEGMGYAYGLVKWGIKDGFNVAHIDDMINNDFAKFFHETSKGLDNSLPIYGSFDYNEGNILQKMETAKFWANDAVDGLSFLASAYGGSFIGKGIGAAASKLGSVMGAGLETANIINKYASFGAGTIYNTVSEAGFEAKDSYDSIYPEVKKQMIAQVTKKYSDAFGNVMVAPDFIEQEAEQLAKEKTGQAAANVFVGNLAALSVSNSFEMKAFLGNPMDESRKLFRQIVKGEIKEGEISAWKQAAKGLTLGVGTEGLWEEGIQNAMQQYQKKKALGQINDNGFTGGYFKEWLKGFSNTEGQASMILGAIIGGPFQAHSYYQEAIQKETDISELTKEVARHRESILASDKIFQSFIENRYKKNADGSVLLDKNSNPVLNEEWYKDKAYQIQLDEDYQKEKINALLKGDMTAAHVVDQYYVSRKLWNYLANPIYENSNEAFEAFQNNLKTQSEEYQAQAEEIKKAKAAETTTEVAMPLGDAVDNNLFNKEQYKKDFDNALIQVQGIKQEFDKIQESIKLDPTDPKSSLIHEKVSKALFHEVTKRKALEKVLQDPTLSSQTREDILSMIESSKELSDHLLDKKKRKAYIDDELNKQETLENKLKEIDEIVQKYKAKPELEKKKSGLEKLKDKSKGLLKPIISKFERKQAAQQEAAVAPVEEKKTEKPVEEKMSKEDEDKLKKLYYDVSKNFYQNGNTYLQRINSAYESDVSVGKKYQYYKELGEEEIRKEKIKDEIDNLLSQLHAIIDNSFHVGRDYYHIKQVLNALNNAIVNYTKQYNEENNFTQTNYTKKDLIYIENVEKQLSYLLFKFEGVLDDEIKKVKEEVAKFNPLFSETKAFLEEAINDLNSFNLSNDVDLDIETHDISKEVYTVFGAPLIYLSFMNNYFITDDDFQQIKQQLVENNVLIPEDALEILSGFIEDKGITNTDEDSELKQQIIEVRLATSFQDLHPDDAVKLYHSLLNVESIGEIKKDFIKNEEAFLKGYQENIDSSKKHMDTNAFLQLWKKDMEHQDEFFESLFIKENPDFSFNISKIIVEEFKKNLHEKNESELNKIEDVFYYQNRLDELKDIAKILKEKTIVSKELLKTQKEIDSLIETYENHIIPLAIKNQSNRKVVQEIALGVRDKSYFAQLGLNVEISLTGQVQLKGGTAKLVELIKSIYGLDISTMKLSERFNFLVVEKIINEIKSKPKEELKPLFKLITELKKEVSEEIRLFENTKSQAVFQSNITFKHYLENPDSIIEKLIYDMSHFNDPTMRTYHEKENWFSSPLYNYSKHLSPGLLLDELKKKKFSGSVLMPYQKLVDYLELHLEFNALHNLEKNLKSDLKFTNYYTNLREQVNTNAFAPTYQQEIALREAYEWWNNKNMSLGYLKGVAGTGKTSVFLKYFLETNKISLDSIVLAAHGKAQVDTLKGVSENANGMTISELLTKDKSFFDKLSLIVIDEINANTDVVIKNILDKLTVLNKDRKENDKIKILFLGDPTQLRVTNNPFIDFFSSYANTYSVKYAEQLKVFSPLTVAYRSDVGAINTLANAFRDTNVSIQNKELQSSAELSDKNAKGAFLASTERTNGLLNDIIKRLDTIKEESSTKAIIVATPQEVADYQKELLANNINNVEVLTIDEAQGRTFDEVFVDIIKSNLEKTKLGIANENDKEYFFNTAMYTAISRAKNLVMLNDNSGSFTHAVKDDVADNNKDLLKEKLELKGNMLKYIDFAETLKEPETTPETPPVEPEEEVTPEEEEKEEDFEEDEPGDELPEEEDEPEIEYFGPDSFPDILEIQNPEYNTIIEQSILGEKLPPVAQKGNDVIFMKSSDSHIYAYVRNSNNPNSFSYLTTMYYKNLRDHVPTEKALKDAYNANTETRLLQYDKNALEESSINKKHQIGSGNINMTQRLQFIYGKVAERTEIEQAIEDEGGLKDYIEKRLMPLVLKKGETTDTYGKITNYKVFIPRKDNEQKGQDPHLINSITEVKYGHPYLKFDVEKTDDKGHTRIQTFFVKLEAPMLKSTDAIAAPLINFYNGIVTLEKELEAAGFGFLKLGNNDFNNLLLSFKKDFKPVEDGKVLDKVTNQPKKDRDGKDIIKYKIVPKDTSTITKDDIFSILKDQNLSEEDALKILNIFQKESKNLIPLIFSSKKDQVKTSAKGYLDFLREQVEKGIIAPESIKQYEYYFNSVSDNPDPIDKRLTDIALNKTYLNSHNVTRSFRAAGFDLNTLNENVVVTTRQMRREITENSFVPIVEGEHKGKFFAFDPKFGEVVVVDQIPPRKFVSRSYTSANGIELQQYEEVRLTKKSSPSQNSFNSIGRANGRIQTGPNPEDSFNLRLSYLVNKGKESQRTIMFVPSLIKENKYDTNFDKKYYSLLKNAFNDHISKLKREGKPYEFNLSYEDEIGNHIQFQYKEQLDKSGKSIWRSPGIIGKFRREASLQDENALKVMKDFLISEGATMKIDGESVPITEELLNSFENSNEEKTITSDLLSHVVGEGAFDESGTSKMYRKNIDRDYVNDTQDATHGGSSFENNIPLQKAMTTRLKGVLPARVQVSLNGVKSTVTTPSASTPSAKAPVRMPKDGDSFISDSGQEYTYRGVTKKGDIQFTLTKNGGKGVWAKAIFEDYIRTGRLKYVEPKPEPIERKTLLENGTYFLDQLENGKFAVYDNTEYPQDFTYDSYEDAEKKYNDLTATPKEEAPVYNAGFRQDLKVDKGYIEVARAFIVQTENYEDPSEVAAVETALNKIFTKTPDITLKELADKLYKKYKIDSEEFMKEFEGYYSKKQC